jgi:protein phosphatase
LKVLAGNAQNIGARQEQQDSFGFSDPHDQTFLSHGGFLGVVADGMGGLAHGSEASLTAVRIFLQAYRSKAPTESIPEALVHSLSAANQAVVQLAEKLGSANGTGTTLAAAVLHRDSLYWISAGDSRIYLCRGNALTRVTSDHVYAHQLNEKVAEGTLSRAEAKSHSERATLTSYLGDLKGLDRNLRPFLLRKSDCVLLCSDGFYHALTEAEIVEAFRGDPQTACETLVERAVAKRRRQQDNLTVIALTNASKGERRSSGWRVGSTVAGLILLGGVGGGIWWLRQHRAAPVAAPTTPPATQPADNAATPAPTASPLEATTASPSASTGKSAAAPNQVRPEEHRSMKRSSKRKPGQKTPASAATTPSPGEGAAAENIAKDQTNNDQGNKKEPKTEANPQASPGNENTPGSQPTPNDDHSAPPAPPAPSNEDPNPRASPAHLNVGLRRGA